MKFIYRFFIIFFIFLAQSNVVAESTIFNKTEVEARVNERWKTIINHKFGEAYNYETPTYRAVFTKDLYKNQFSHEVDWSLTKIVDIKYDPATNVATVVVVVETKPKNSNGLDSTANIASVEIREKWLHIKGRWWHSSNE